MIRTDAIAELTGGITHVACQGSDHGNHLISFENQWRIEGF